MYSPTENLPQHGKSSKPRLSQQESEAVTAQLCGFEQQFHDTLDCLPIAVYTTDAAGYITFYNQAAARLWGRRPELHSGRWCGSWHLYAPDGTSMAHDECPMAVALKQKRAVVGQEAMAERPDGTRVPFVAYPSLLRDTAGNVTGAINMLVETTESKLAEHLQQRLASIVESSDDAIVGKDLNGVIMSWNRGAEQLFGYTEEEVRGRSITILIPHNLQSEEHEILSRVRRGERVEHYETIRRRKDGTLVDISLTVSPIRARDGRIVGASKVARDISDRRRKEEHIAFLAREVDHRSNNLLSLVQAIVHLTQANSSDELRSAIDGRVRALASAHSLLTQSQWSGADLGALVAKEFAPYAREENTQISATGPSVTLGARTAQALAVTLHELTTNAIKYGALSRATGHIRVEWQRAIDGSLSIHWSESGGPAVSAPTRNGFGTNVIARMIRDQLRGEISFDWRRDGFACEISLPASAIATVAPSASI